MDDTFTYTEEKVTESGKVVRPLATNPATDKIG